MSANGSVLTNVGRNKQAAKLAGGQELVLTHISFGDADRIPSGGETELGSEHTRLPIIASGFDPATSEAPAQAWFEVFVDESLGPFVVRECGLWDEDGTLIALSKREIAKSGPDDPHSFAYRMYVVFASTENIVVRVAAGALNYVPSDRKIVAGDGLSGTGDLTGDRQLEVDFASMPEHVAGRILNKVAHPAGVSAMIAADNASKRNRATYLFARIGA